MSIVVAVVLFIIGAVFAANMLGSLSGRYGQTRMLRNALLAGGVAAASIAGGVVLL